MTVIITVREMNLLVVHQSLSWMFSISKFFFPYLNSLILDFKNTGFPYLYFEDSSDLYISSRGLKWHRPLWAPPAIPVKINHNIK